ncbi:uncharacterized protein LOC119277483 isoform X2 [Triticum dicoccoides]|uniref:uncharacterized protein LOC119277483 isoform X2 n=1 Tax=Triticum dicoccoides TaxID=85692 RepID=UPI00188E4DCA|nr:uncharacterized protein LOC119277483 isoform X2 [Triticum dicoccoides]
MGCRRWPRQLCSPAIVRRFLVPRWFQQNNGASRRKGSRDDDGQNNPAEAARGSSRQITISARIQWKNLVKNKVSIIWRQGKEDHVIIWPVQVPMPLYLPSKPGSAS